jgi:hypothetical protein
VRAREEEREEAETVIDFFSSTDLSSIERAQWAFLKSFQLSENS